MSIEKPQDIDVKGFVFRAAFERLSGLEDKLVDETLTLIEDRLGDTFFDSFPEDSPEWEMVQIKIHDEVQNLMRVLKGSFSK